MSVQRSDKYSYFLTSKSHVAFEVEKFHLCTWLYTNGHECVEVGLQIKLGAAFDNLPPDASGRLRDIPLEVWIPWVSEKNNEVRGLYREIANKENAQFIFNEACPTSRSIDDWGDEFGQILTFKYRGALSVLPFDASIGEGRVKVVIHVPCVCRPQESVYVRFVVSASKASPAFHLKTVASDVYSYNVNIGQLRNAPSGFPTSELCKIKDFFCLHIVPSSYCQTFSDPRAFRNLRFLEVSHYNSYVKDQDIFKGGLVQDDHLVSFNKLSNNKASETNAFSVYSSFTKDSIGRKQIWNAILINIVCAALVAAASWVSGVLFKAKVDDDVAERHHPELSAGLAGLK